MASEWTTTTIAECASDEPYSTQIGPFGDKIRSDTYVQAGAPVLRGTNVNTNSRFHDDDFVFIDSQIADAEFGKFVCEVDDVILCHKGTLGKIGIIPKVSKYPKYIMGNSMMKVRCNRAKLEPLYLYYWLTSQEGQSYLFSRVSQVGVPQIQRPLTTLREAKLRLPPHSEQKRIAHILGTLDDKIELNRRMNATLEAMAQALFQSWFVDFDPVRAKAAGQTPAGVDKATADLFPSEFEDSALGEIPKGWTTTVLDDLASLILGGDWGASSPDEDQTQETVCIRGADIPSLQDGGLGKMPTRYLKPSSAAKRGLAPGDLVVEISGGSPTQSTGRPVQASKSLLSRVDVPIVCSNFCRVVKLKSSEMSDFVYLWLRHLYDAGSLFAYETGTTGIKNLAFTRFAASHHLVNPPAPVLRAFNRVVAPLVARQQLNGIESETLAATRDALLPKLLRGEMNVIEQMVG